MEVMEPESLCKTMKEWAKSLWELYKQDCKLLYKAEELDVVSTCAKNTQVRFGRHCRQHTCGFDINDCRKSH